MPLREHSSRSNKKGFFARDELRPEKADSNWSDEEWNAVLEMFIQGAMPQRVAHAFNRSEDSIRRRILRLVKNEDGLAERYVPLRRTSRKGTRLTNTDDWIIKKGEEAGVPASLTAKILMRDPNEIRLDIRGALKVNLMKQAAPTTDVLWALRFLYHCSKVSIVSDQAYDTALAEEIEYGGGSAILGVKASKVVSDYPPHIRSLAFYLHFKHMEEKGEWKADKLPMGWVK